MERRPRRERKIVTVLFADLVGFTARAETLDPEDVEAILRPYHERLRTELERFGGTVEKFIGDAVMALFGAPVAHEDDPERAVRAALAIRDWIAEEGKLEVRIAVNTGEALVNLEARPEAGHGMAAGDVVNTTARLQSAAPVNGVLVGEATYRATRNVVDYTPADPVEAKGKTDRIPVWEATEARARVRTEAVSTAAPVIGREREVALLRETLVRVREEAAPQLVTIVGVAGIGKSRLVRELFEFVEKGGVLTFWRQGRSLPYGEGVTFWALAEIVKAQAGILETDGNDDAERKLRSAISNLVADAAEAERLEQFLRPLVGVSGDTGLEHASQAETFAAWRQLFETMADQHPLVLVFEDVQWANDGLLDFIDHLVDWTARLPVLIVCTARPELLERRPGWGGGKLNVTTLSLSPLSDEDTARLLRQLLGTPVVEAEHQQALLTRAGGNPLYAEQFAQMLAEKPAGSDDDVPETVQGIIAARVDRLPQIEKELLQDAAVVGKVFWLGSLTDARVRADVERLLHSLERKGFVQRARRTSVASEPEYAFLHVLVCDVAYGQIPRADRATKHLRVAEWIESLGRSDDHAEMLAYHYGSALDLARAADTQLPDVLPRSRTAFHAAGDRAQALAAHAAAARFYERSLALYGVGEREGRADVLFKLGRALKDAGDDRQHEMLEAARASLLEIGDADRAAETHALQAESRWIHGDFDRATSDLRDAEELVRDRPPSASKARILAESARFHMVADRTEPAIRLGGEALALAAEFGLDEVRAGALVTVASARRPIGDERAIDELREALQYADTANASAAAFRAINNLAVGLRQGLGDIDGARRLAEDGLRRAERVGDRGQIIWFYGILADDEFWLGHLDRALALAEAVLEHGPEHYQAQVAHQVRARIRLARDDVAGALSDIEQGIELARRTNEAQAMNPNFSSAAFVLVSAGRHHEAAGLVDAVLADMRSRKGSGLAEHAFLVLAMAAGELGRHTDFLDATSEISGVTPWLAAGRAYAAGDVDGTLELSERLSVPDSAWIRLRAAALLVEHGNQRAAQSQITRALAFWRSVGATRYIREGESFLAATA
jgi:class 3 adenylate cyclase/tetratricopeptide (TPR) repeat protein